MKKIIILFSTLFVCNILHANDQVIIEKSSLYPEGISYDTKENRFLVSSISRGEIWSINKKGETTLFAKTRYPSTVGLLVNSKMNQLLVCIADPGASITSSKKTKGKLAKLIIYDLTSKAKIHEYDLAAIDTNKPHMANDVTYDNQSNIYITDSFSPNIYKITNTGKLSILTTNHIWDTKEGQFGLNGIVYHPDGYLIVAHYATHTLYKVALDTPHILHKINFSQEELTMNQKLKSIDGLYLINDKNLALVSNSFTQDANGNGVYILQSTDKWNSAIFTKSMVSNADFPTTLTRKDNELYVMHSHLPVLFSGNKHPVKSFEIEKVTFKDIHHVTK